MNKAYINIGLCIKICFYFYWVSNHVGLGYMGGICLIFQETLKFSKAVVPLRIHIGIVWKFHLLNSSSAFALSVFIYFNHSSKHVAISIDLVCVFLMVKDFKHLFVYLFVIHVSSLRSIHSNPLPFYYWVVYVLLFLLLLL